MDDVVVGVHGVKDLPELIPLGSGRGGFDARIIAEPYRQAPGGHRREPSEPLAQRLGIGRLHRQPVVGAGAEKLDQNGAHLFDRARRADAHEAPPFQEPDAFVKLDPTGEVVAPAGPAPDEFGVFPDRGDAAAAFLL